MPNYTIDFEAMGSTIQIWLNALSPETASVLNDAIGWFAEWEQTFSRFRPSSELSELNRRRGSWSPVSADMWAVLVAARRMYDQTGGLFNPALLDAVEAAGYDHSFDPDRIPFIPGEARSISIGRGIFTLDHTRCAVLIPPDVRLDLGGIVKGWAAERAAEKLAMIGPCLVDAGGDIVGRGSPDDSGGWYVTVYYPDHPNTRVLLCDSTIATSGIDYRRWVRDDQTLHHIIDPRTARPAQTKMVTATVIAPSAVEAEAFAKAALILGQPTSPHPTLLIDESDVAYSNVDFSALLAV